MAFPGSHYLFAFGGVQAVNEEWSMGLRIDPNFAINDQAEEEATLQAMATALGTWWASGISSASATLTWAKLNQIGADGRYTRDYTNLWEYVAPVVPSGGGTMPPQVALVVTLETGFARGLAHRGRMFFPSPRYSLDANTRTLSPTNSQAAADLAAGLLDSLHTAAGGPRVAIYSAVGAGAKRLVTGVTVGSVYDTMRSRRAQLEEVRSAAAIAAGP